MNISKVEKLLELMKENDIKLLEVEYRRERYKLELKESATEKNRKQCDLLHNDRKEMEEIIKSPTAGIVQDVAWGKSVANGTKEIVKKGDLLCKIEIMKSYQEILAEHDMKLLEVLFKEGQLVEYGQPLYRVERMR